VVIFDADSEFAKEFLANPSKVCFLWTRTWIRHNPAITFQTSKSENLALQTWTVMQNPDLDKKLPQGGLGGTLICLNNLF
jgi:hypothetical protein